MKNLPTHKLPPNKYQEIRNSYMRKFNYHQPINNLVKNIEYDIYYFCPIWQKLDDSISVFPLVYVRLDCLIIFLTVYEIFVDFFHCGINKHG